MNQAFTTEARILSFNLNAQGIPEGIIAKSQNDIAQINFQADLANDLGKILRVGDNVELVIAPDNGPGGRGPGGPPGGPPGRGPEDGGPAGRGPADGGPPAGPAPVMPVHPVFRLIALRTADGRTFGGPGNQTFSRVEGNIKVLNYDRRGVPNGAQLDTGDLVRLGPREAQLVDLDVGARVTAEGPALTMPNGKLSLQAQRLNDQDLRPAPPPPPPGRGPEGGPDGPPPGPEGRGPGGPPPQ
jgi:hypothetical protein